MNRSDLTYRRILALAMIDSLKRNDIAAFQQVSAYAPASSITAALIVSNRLNEAKGR